MGPDVSKIPTRQQVNLGRGIARKNAIIDLCIVPIGVGVSLSPYVAACEKVLMDDKIRSVEGKLAGQ